MKKCLYSLLILYLLFCVHQVANATHINGASITYTHIALDYFEVKVVIYEDCFGTLSSDSINLNISSVGCLTDTKVLPLRISENLNQICSTDSNACLGGTLPGYFVHEYSDTIQLPGNCQYNLSSVIASRSSADNINNSTSTNLYIEAAVYKNQAPFNHSPEFLFDPIAFLPVSSLDSLSYYCFDLEGDSLVYSLQPALVNTSTSVTYPTGYSAAQPLGIGASIALSTDGILELTPPFAGRYGIKVGVDEYRDGILIGHVEREFIHNIYNGSSAGEPTISGVDSGTASLDTLLDLGVAHELVIKIEDTTTVHVNYQSNLPDTIISLDTISPGQVLLKINWTPTVFDAAVDPFYLSIEALNDVCPISGVGQKIFTYRINAEDSVWPGDVDYNGTADVYDILPLGFAYSATGPLRSSASILWTAQSSTNWDPTWSSGLNFKHADCDGSGIIDSTDATAILTNYGLTHSKTQQSTAEGLPLYIKSSADSITENMPLQFDVILGDSSHLADKIYALAFKLEFPDELIGSTATVNYSVSTWGDLNTNFIAIDTLIGNTEWHIGMSKIDYDPFAGEGVLCRLEIITADDLAGLTLLDSVVISPTQIKALNVYSGSESIAGVHQKVELNLSSTVVSQATAVNPNKVRAYPNPFVEQLFVSDITNNTEYAILNAQGQLVQKGITNGEITLSGVGEGVYFLKYHSKGVSHIHRLIKVKL